MKLLTLDQVGVKVTDPYGNDRWILKDVSLSLQRGERIGLMGPNGCGKTTLARMMGGLQRPTAGRIRTHGAPVALVLQRPEDHFIAPSVAQQVGGFSKRKMARAEIVDLIDQVGLPAEVVSLPPLRLSGGWQRLVAIACALATGAPFVVLDEPMAGLDSSGRRLVAATVSNLAEKRGIGFVFISHQPDDLLGLVDRLWIMNSGRLLYDGDLAQAPLEVLDTCFPPTSSSLYIILRRIESREIVLPKSIYREFRPGEIARLLAGALAC